MTVSTTSSCTVYMKQCSTPPRVMITPPSPSCGKSRRTPENVAADLNLHSGLAKIDIAAILQFKAHHVLHNPREARSYRDQKVSRPDAIREVAEDGQCWAKGCRATAGAHLMHQQAQFRTFQVQPKNLPVLPRQRERTGHTGFERGSPCSI